MVSFLSLFAIFEIANFTSYVLYESTPKNDVTWQDTFLLTMQWTLAVSYGINIFAFIPLFIVVMTLLNRQFRSLFVEIRLKVMIIFMIFLGVIIFRFLYYLCLSFEAIDWIDVRREEAEIPFYISEIAIALCFMYFLVSLYTRQMGQVEEEKQKAEAQKKSPYNYF